MLKIEVSLLADYEGYLFTCQLCRWDQLKKAADDEKP